MKVIGVVGPLACGKGVVTDYLIKNYGFISFSLSYIVHEEVKKRGISSFTRTTLQDIGDELRKTEGDGVLAKRAMEYLTKHNASHEKIVIEGIRNPGEVAYLRSLPDFYLIAVDATKELRYRRVIERGKPWDPKDWESFEKVDGRDQGDAAHSNGQQVRASMKCADVTIENNTDMKELYSKIEAIVQNILS